MLTRRTLLGSAAALSALGPACAGRRSSLLDPALDGDALWRAVQDAFDVDRTVINLNSGHCSPSPRSVHAAYKQELDRVNASPPWRLGEQQEQKAAVRAELAQEAGCAPEELALTRGTSESMQIVQLGIPLSAGDEVLISEQDYPRMRNTWAQRARRDGIVVRTVSLPASMTDPQPLLDAYAAARTQRTRALLVSHVVFMTGQVLPVKALCAWARARGIVSIVDGAHAFAQVPVDLHDIGCDYYGTSLHKWLMAPLGTGFLYVRRDRIRETWALQPAPAYRDDDIRKFEAIGTHPPAGHSAIAAALAFHRQIGLARKSARLRQLRARWSDALRGLPGVTLHTPDHPDYGAGIGLVDLGGRLPSAVRQVLWERARILSQGINPGAFRGIRVSPNLFTTTDEIDQFVAIAEEIVTA